MIQNKELRNYYKQLSSLLPAKMYKKIISELQNNVQIYLSDHPEASYEDLIRQFGTPEEIAAGYLETLDKTEYTSILSENARKKRFRITILIIIAAAIAGLYTSVLLYDRSITPEYYKDYIQYEGSSWEEI